MSTLGDLVTPLMFGSQLALLSFVWAIEAPIWARVIVSFLAGMTMMINIKSALIEDRLNSMRIEREVREELMGARRATS